MTNSEKKKKSGMPTFLILLMFIAATGFWYVAIYGEGDIFEFDDRMTVSASSSNTVSDIQSNATNIDLAVNADVADFTVITEEDMSTDIIQVFWDYSVRAKKETPFTIDLDFHTENDTLYYTITILQNEDLMFLSISEFDVLILISKDIVQLDISLLNDVGSVEIDLNEIIIGDLYVETTTGSIDVWMFNSEILGSFTLDATTGTIDVEIGESTLNTYTTITTTTGSINVDFSNLEFSDSADVSIDATTGSIEIDWVQNRAYTNDVVLDLDVTTGSIDLGISSPLSITAYDIYLSTSLGDTWLGGDTEDFVALGGEHYQSVDYETSLADILTIHGDTTLGSIAAEIYVN